MLRAMVRSGNYEGWVLDQGCMALRLQIDVLMHARVMS